MSGRTCFCGCGRSLEGRRSHTKWAQPDCNKRAWGTRELNDDELAMKAVVLGDPCAYCGGHGSDSKPCYKLTADHIVPIANGGERASTNMTACCGGCNSRKGGRSLLDFLLWVSR
jgi:5-methylcytosine-specific restriction endonuclease McrA